MSYDPNNQINALLAWYRLGRDNLGMRDSSMGGVKTGVNEPLAFAQQMLGQQQPEMEPAPDFFSNQPPQNALLKAYTPPASFNEPMPVRRPTNSLTPQMRDYISRTLR